MVHLKKWPHFIRLYKHLPRCWACYSVHASSCIDKSYYQWWLSEIVSQYIAGTRVSLWVKELGLINVIQTLAAAAVFSTIIILHCSCCCEYGKEIRNSLVELEGVVTVYIKQTMNIIINQPRCSQLTCMHDEVGVYKQTHLLWEVSCTRMGRSTLCSPILFIAVLNTLHEGTPLLVTLSCCCSHAESMAILQLSTLPRCSTSIFSSEEYRRPSCSPSCFQLTRSRITANTSHRSFSAVSEMIIIKHACRSNDHCGVTHWVF